MDIVIPDSLADSCREGTSRQRWLAALPDLVSELQARWSLQLGPPYAAKVAWVAPDLHRPVVLKIGLPHMEADHEIDGLRFWDGEPTAKLVQFDVDNNAMLLERCDPGTPLSAIPDDEQDVIMAGLLRRLWRVPPASHVFRPLSTMTQRWSAEARQRDDRWIDAGLVQQGLRLFHDLPQTAKQQVLLATDLHAGNVLQSSRQPWLVIDPKPFVGDPAYDATSHLINRSVRLAQPLDTIHRFADLLELDRERVRLWLFARAAVDPWDRAFLTFVRAIAP